MKNVQERGREARTGEKLLGVWVESIDKEGLLSRAVEYVKRGEPAKITYVNAHCLNVAAEDEEYRATLNQFDLVYSDGVGVVWAGRALKNQRMYKVTGRQWIDEFCTICEVEGISLYLLGGKPGIAREAAERLRMKRPKLQILGVCDGYFVENSEANVLRELEEKKPDVLLVGMGVPRQEKWVMANRERLPVRVCWGVGALFDYIAEVEPIVPKWMEELALEWLWRWMVDPRDKWKRYMLGTPQFIGRVLWQKVKER